MKCSRHNASTNRPRPRSPKPKFPYTIVDNFTLNFRARSSAFISVVVPQNLSDQQLLAVAGELHKLHPSTTIHFYDKLDRVKIKEWNKCAQDIFGKLPCPHEEINTDWINDHDIGRLDSKFD